MKAKEIMYRARSKEWGVYWSNANSTGLYKSRTKLRGILKQMRRDLNDYVIEEVELTVVKETKAK